MKPLILETSDMEILFTTNYEVSLPQKINTKSRFNIQINEKELGSVPGSFSFK